VAPPPPSKRTPTPLRVAAEPLLPTHTPQARSPPINFPPLFARPPSWLLLFCLTLGGGIALSATAFAASLAPLLGVKTGAEARELLLKAASIPLVSILFTYCHIWLALWMTFLPVDFVGCARIPNTNVGLGWQGIVPFKALVFARKACDNLIPALISPQECVGRVDAEALVVERREDFDALAVAAVEAAVAVAAPRVWRRMPVSAQKRVFDAARAAAPQIVSRVLADLRAEAELDPTLFDIRSTVLEVLTHDRQIAVDAMIEMGRPELAFIRNSGALMGGFFGLIQLGLWWRWPQRDVAVFTMPAFGCVVSALTNWLALLIIFRPLHPVRFCGGKLIFQGFFLRRQREVAVVYARIITHRVLTPQHLTHIMSRGRAGKRLRELIRMRTMEATEVPAPGADIEAAAAAGAIPWNWWLVIMARSLGVTPSGAMVADATSAESDSETSQRACGALPASSTPSEAAHMVLEAGSPTKCTLEKVVPAGHRMRADRTPGSRLSAWNTVKAKVLRSAKLTEEDNTQGFTARAGLAPSTQPSREERNSEISTPRRDARATTCTISRRDREGPPTAGASSSAMAESLLGGDGVTSAAGATSTCCVDSSPEGRGSAGRGGYASGVWDEACTAASDVVVEGVPRILDASADFVERSMDLTRLMAHRWESLS